MPQPLPVASAPAESETSSPLTKNLESRFKNKYVVGSLEGDGDSNSIVLSRTQLNNMTTYLRTYISKMKGAKTAIEYCEIGMTKDEFMSVYLLIEGRRNSSVMISHMTLVLPTRWKSLPTSLKSSKTHRTKWISVRWSVPSSIHWMTRYVLPSDWLMHRISIIVCCSSSMSMILMVRITCPNRTSKISFQRCISLLITTRLSSYAMYPSLPNSSSKDIEISINSIFIMKKGDNQGLFFFVYSMKSIQEATRNSKTCVSTIPSWTPTLVCLLMILKARSRSLRPLICIVNRTL